MQSGRKLNPVDYFPCPCFNTPSRKKRIRKFRTPRRIKMLAQPKCVTPKREPEITLKFKQDIQIIRDEPVSTRLMQLSIPKVRKLVAARNEYARFKNEYFIERFNQMIKKSLFTVYSRLANVEVPLKRKKPEKWTDAEWRAHQQWLGSRAKHKWPYDFQFPGMFTDPITKLPPRKVLMKRPDTPWIKQYQKQLQAMTEQGLEKQKPDIYEAPRLNAEEWKKKRKMLKSRPVTPYIEEYGERLRAQAAEMKGLREERKAELHPGPREKWDYNARQRELEQEYKSRPKWVEKLSTPPAWIKEKADKEAAEIKYLQERRKEVGNHYKILKFSGRPRTLRLALATEEQKEEVKELLEVQKKEKEAILQGFKLKNPKMETLPPAHKLYKSVQKLSQPLERFKREKVKFPENYNRFINYW